MQWAPGTDRELTGEWRAAAADDHLRRSYTEADFDDAAWHPIDVPGHWRSSPHFADSDGPLLHRCRFDAAAPAPGRRAWLTLDGLFQQGDVWLDGGYLGDTEGYFVPHSFEVTDALRSRGEHALAVEATCGPERGSSRRNLTGAFQHADHLDPRWNPGGIWRPVRLTESGPVRIARLRVVCSEATAQRAVLSLRAVLDSDAVRRVRLRTEVGAIDHEVDQPLATGDNDVSWTVTIEHPVLWWPRALGAAVLHDLRVAVVLADDDAGAVSDERRLRTGLRSVRMRNWITSVNGERLFLKGADLGPTRMALGEAPPDELRRDVDLAVGAGLDLVRVHAHVTRSEVYDAADEAGLLVWQDMPLTGTYARGVRRQATRQATALVDLLGHHPSIAVWCGHDQPTAQSARAAGARPAGPRGGLTREQQLPTWNRTVLDASIRRALRRADGSRPVVAHSGVAPHLPQIDGTDSHLYLGWTSGDERDLPRLARRFPRMVRFVSELGAQAVPSGDGAAFARPERWPHLDWDRLEARHGLQREAMARRVPPSDHATFDGWRDATQRYQATVIRRQIEELRRLKYRPTGGFAQYLLADGQPGITWSVLDHDRRPKLGYEALRAACRPAIVVADRLPAALAPGDTLALDVHVVSDLRHALEGARVDATLSWPGGAHRWAWTGDVPADACARIGTIQAVVPAAARPARTADGPTGHVGAGALALDLSLALPDGEVVTNRYEADLAA